MLTEQQNQQSQNIDQLSTGEILQVINAEDAKVAIAVEQALPQITKAVDAIVKQLEAGGRLIYVGAGTSGRLGILDAVECVPTYSTSPELVIGLIAGGKTALTEAVEGAEDHPEYGARDLEQIELTSEDVVVGIAASGRTSYVLGAIEKAKELGCVTVGIACNIPSPLLESVQLPIGVEVGAEVVTGSTRMKAGTAQKMILNMISTATMIRLGKVYGNLMIDVKVTNAKLEDRAKRIVSQVTGVSMEEATQLLQRTDMNVKLAIVVHEKNVSVDEARNLLQKAKGRLRDVLENLPSQD